MIILKRNGNNPECDVTTVKVLPLRSVTCVVHGVGEKVRALGAQAKSSHRVAVAVHVVDQLVLPQVPHLCHTHTHENTSPAGSCWIRRAAG